MKADISRYTTSESTAFTFVGRAEGNTTNDMLGTIENCLIGLNLEPDEGWAWVPEGLAIQGDLTELLTDRVAVLLHDTAQLDDVTRRGLAFQFAVLMSEVLPRFDRDRFLSSATGENPDLDS